MTARRLPVPTFFLKTSTRRSNLTRSNRNDLETLRKKTEQKPEHLRKIMFLLSVKYYYTVGIEPTTLQDLVSVCLMEGRGRNRWGRNDSVEELNATDPQGAHDDCLQSILHYILH